jgi:hypothetical protein
MAAATATIDRYDYAAEHESMREQRGDDENPCIHKRAC